MSGAATDPTPTQYTLTVNTTGSGSVIKNPDKPTYNQGDQVTLTATANSGCNFSTWSGDASGTANPVILTMNGNKTVTANFTQIPPSQYTLAIVISGSGSVTKNPDKSTYNQGDQVTLTATPGSGFTFSNWSGDASGTANPVILTMNGNKTVTANFTQIPPSQYTLAIVISGSGSVTKNPDKSTYNQGDQVTLTATANSGYNFSNWSGDASGTANPVILTMNGNKTVTATFTQASPSQHTLRVNIIGSGSVTKNPDKITYDQWEQVTLSATPASGFTFSVWSGDASGTTNPVILTMNGNKTVTANFTQIPPSQCTLAIIMVGSGSVTKNPDKLTYNPGDQVTLTANPGSGFAFSNWSGDASGTTNPVILTMNGNKTVTANFNQIPPSQYTLAIVINGSGSVTKNPDKPTYNQGDQVTLTATPGSGFTFSNWSGDASGTANPVILTMNGNKTVTVNFSSATGNLVVTPSTGLSASGPQGGPFSPSTQVYTLENKGGAAINWGASKTQNWVNLSSSGGSLAPGTSTTVTASINSGANTLTAGYYSDTITFNNFTNGSGTTTRSVSLTAGSNSQGNTVTTDPPGLFVVVDGSNYKSPQTFNWAPGSSHTVSVTELQFGPSGGQCAFRAWSDGGAQSHTITASSADTIYVASFNTQYSLTTFINPSGAGQVVPSGVSWYNAGESVPVSAMMNPGYTFSSWSGDLSGASNPTSIVMNGSKVITANYSPSPCSLTVNANPSGMGTVTKNPDKSIYGYGEQVTLTARGNEGYNFKNWSGDSNGEVNPLTVVIKGNMTVVANFAPTGSLEAIPSEGLSAEGRQGGTFSPSNQTYTLQNRGQIPVKWKVSKKPRWVTLSLTNGSLAPGETAQVEVSINSSAKQLRMGSYNDVILFSNASNGNDSLSRSAAITVKPPIKTYTVKTNPDGVQIIVDGVTYTSPQTFEWEVGSSHTLDTPSPQTSTSGTQSVFSSWSNRKSQNQTITASSSGTTYTVKFKTQYVLTTSVSPSEGGTVTPAGTNWFNQGKRVSVTARSNEGYQFINWSGDASGSRSPITVAMEGPINLVANFGKIGAPEVSHTSGLMAPTHANLPIIGELESPSEGKRVLGQKTIYGWALDGEGISKIKLFMDGEYICDIPYGGLREDLKEAYPDYPNAEKGGFALIWNYSSLSPGLHLVQIEIQNMKGEVLRLSANISVRQFSGDMITQVNPNEWLIPGVNLTVDGNSKRYDVKLEWSNDSQSFEIIDLYSP